MNLYQALYAAYRTGNLQETLDSFLATQKTSLSLKDTLGTLDENTLTLHFKHFIEEIKRTHQEIHLPVKMRNIIDRLIAAQSQCQLAPMRDMHLGKN